MVKRWTAVEIATLKNMAQNYPTAQIATELGRGVAAVAVKAHELKLSLRMRKTHGAEQASFESRQGPAN